MTRHFVLMADIIRSRGKDASRLMDQFRALVRIINEEHAEWFLSPLTITLGDEFQAIASTEYSGVRAIVALEEEIVRKRYDFKLRYVLNYGEIGTPINKSVAYGMLGQGLIEARNRLSESKHARRRFSFVLKELKSTETLTLLFVLYQSIVDGWRLKDYIVIAEFLSDEDYKAVAKKLGRDPSLMWRRKQSLKIEEYAALKKLIFSAISP